MTEDSQQDPTTGADPTPTPPADAPTTGGDTGDAPLVESPATGPDTPVEGGTMTQAEVDIQTLKEEVQSLSAELAERVKIHEAAGDSLEEAQDANEEISKQVEDLKASNEELASSWAYARDALERSERDGARTPIVSLVLSCVEAIPHGDHQTKFLVPDDGTTHDENRAFFMDNAQQRGYAGLDLRRGVKQPFERGRKYGLIIVNLDK